MKYTSEDRLLINKIKKMHSSEDELALSLVTMLGSAGALCVFVSENVDLKEIPSDIMYACALIAGNMITFTQDVTQEIVKKNMSQEFPYELDEQTQEGIYRKCKWVVEHLYAVIREIEKEHE